MQTAAVSEDEQVFDWRILRFLELGLTLRQARRLANCGADWHTAEQMIRAGCPVEVLVRILRS